LLTEFSLPLPPDQVRRHLFECIASYHSAVVRSYLPLLIERTTRERLASLVAARDVSSPVRAHASAHLYPS